MKINFTLKVLILKICKYRLVPNVSVPLGLLQIMQITYMFEVITTCSLELVYIHENVSHDHIF